MAANLAVRSDKPSIPRTPLKAMRRAFVEQELTRCEPCVTTKRAEAGPDNESFHLDGDPVQIRVEGPDEAVCAID